MRRWFRSKDVQKGARAWAPPPRRTPTWRSYDVIADVYARSLARHTPVVARDVLALAGARAGSRVLDVGTGTGTALPVAADVVGGDGLVVGVDLAPSMLAATPHPELLLAAAEAINLPFEDGSFDVVMANFVLPHFGKLDTALYDLTRVIAPGGSLGVATWEEGTDDLSATWLTLVVEAVGVEMLRGALKEVKPNEAQVSDARRLEGVLREAGLRPVRVERHRYRFEMSREEYIDAQSTTVEGRFVRGMLGDASWERFRARASTTFAERFPDPVVDFREVLIAAGTKV